MYGSILATRFDDPIKLLPGRHRPTRSKSSRIVTGGMAKPQGRSHRVDSTDAKDLQLEVVRPKNPTSGEREAGRKGIAQ
jgi:hypothetical protein